MLLGYVIEDHMARNCANYCNHFWNISLNLALYLLYKGKSSRFSGGTTKAGDRGKHLFFATFSILTLKYMDTFPLLRASYRTFLSLPFNLEYHCIFSSSEVGWQQFSVHFFVIKIKLGMMSFCKRKRELKISRKSQSTAKKTFGKGWGCLNLHSSHSGPAVFLFFSHTHLVSRWSILKC